MDAVSQGGSAFAQSTRAGPMRGAHVWFSDVRNQGCRGSAGFSEIRCCLVAPVAGAGRHRSPTTCHARVRRDAAIAPSDRSCAACRRFELSMRRCAADRRQLIRQYVENYDSSPSSPSVSGRPSTTCRGDSCTRTRRRWREGAAPGRQRALESRSRRCSYARAWFTTTAPTP